MSAGTLAQRLRAGEREIPLPLRVDLAGDALVLEAWLRVLPGRRYVARALWRGRVVLLKLFCGRHWRRDWWLECQGGEAMQAAGVACASLLARGEADALGWVLFEFLEGGEPLAEAWAGASADLREHWRAAALEACARLHAAGLLHVDLHWGNLLVAGERVWLVDAGSVRKPRFARFCRRQFARNLGDLLAQGPLDEPVDVAGQLARYRAVPGAPALSAPMVERALRYWLDWRLRDYMAKVGRDCSLFSARQDWHLLERASRAHRERLAPLLAAPDQAIAAGRALKLGGSATVAEVQVAGRPLVLKRYNMKSLGHRLKRCWRESRASHSWREGHRLCFLGIPTPEPLAMQECRWGPLRGRAYLVTEYSGGQDILARLNPDAPLPEQELALILNIFNGLVRHRISHGDLKGNNLLWSEGRYLLIDLDAARQHRCLRAFRRAYAEDRARFLRNWPAGSPLYRQLDSQLPTLD